jgi:outer membrane protein assembly factor BamA
MFYGQTLYEKYLDWGIIPKDEKDGGFASALRLGLMFDTRDFEAAPARGIWTEGHITFASNAFGTTYSYYRYMLTFRHYVPIVKEHLTFAYRLNYQGCIGNYLPYYIMPVFSNIGKEYDRDGIGGYRTVRGIMRDRIQGLDVGFLNAELRWRFVKFHLWKQNIALGLNAFFDGGIVTRGYDVSFKVPENDPNYSVMKQDYDNYFNSKYEDNFKGFHAAAGGGFRIIINQNFIIAVDYAMPFNKQDGTKGSLYINTGYLF